MKVRAEIETHWPICQEELLNGIVVNVVETGVGTAIVELTGDVEPYEIDGDVIHYRFTNVTANGLPIDLDACSLDERDEVQTALYDAWFEKQVRP